MLKKFWDWLVKSSQNPQKLSLTIKGVIAGSAVYIVAILGMFGANGVTAEGVQTVGQTFGSLVEAILMTVSALTTAYGLSRKIWNTIKTFRS